MDAREILIQWLRERGYDGLANPDMECGCGLDDLMPCGSSPAKCYPAHGDWENGFFASAEACAYDEPCRRCIHAVCDNYGKEGWV